MFILLLLKDKIIDIPNLPTITVRHYNEFNKFVSYVLVVDCVILLY